MHPEPGKGTVHIAQHFQQGTRVLHPEIVDRVMIRDQIKYSDKFFSDRHIVAGELDRLVDQREKGVPRIDLRNDLIEMIYS